MTVRILDFEAFRQSGFQVGLGLGLEGLGLVNITAVIEELEFKFSWF